MTTLSQLPPIQVTSIKKTGKTYEVTLEAGNIRRYIRNVKVHNLRVGQSFFQGTPDDDKTTLLPPKGELLEIEQIYVADNERN